jgi:hypothetical protein
MPFTTRYPHATKVEWRDKLHYFEATFQVKWFIHYWQVFLPIGDGQGSERELILIN